MSKDRNYEELNISGKSAPQKPTMPEKDGFENQIESHAPDNKSFINPGMTDEQLLDTILSVPSEKLIPWEDCMLPSHGVYYGWPDGMIKVKAMGQKAEKILATQRLAASGQSIDYLFRECARFPDGFDPADLLLGDRVFLLYFLRGITHGNLYEFAVTCPGKECQQVHTHTYDLNNLANTIRQAKRELGPEPFKIVLPYLSEAFGREIWVSVRFLRAFDSNDIIARKKFKKKIIPGVARNIRNSADPRQQQQQQEVLDSALDDNLEKVIVNIMGNNDQSKIRLFVQQLHARDTATIREWLRDNTPGIDNTISIECPDCNNEFTVELPITESFFRPIKQ